MEGGVGVVSWGWGGYAGLGGDVGVLCVGGVGGVSRSTLFSLLFCVCSDVGYVLSVSRCGSCELWVCCCVECVLCVCRCVERVRCRLCAGDWSMSCLTSVLGGI